MAEHVSFDRRSKQFTYGFALLRLELEAQLLDRVVLVKLLHFVAEQVYYMY